MKAIKEINEILKTIRKFLSQYFTSGRKMYLILEIKQCKWEIKILDPKNIKEFY